MYDTSPQAIPYDSTKYLVRRLLGQHIRPQLGKLLIAIICMIVVAAATAATAYLMQPVIDDIFVNQHHEKLLWVVFALLAVTLIKAGASYGQSFFLIYVTQRIVTKMQMQLYRHLLHADIALITGESSGKLVSRFSNDFNILRSAINIVAINFAKEFFTMVFLVGVMFYQSVTLALIAFAAFPIAIYPVVRLGKRMRKISVRTQEELGEFTEKLGESFHNAAVIKAYQQEEAEVARASGVVERIFTLYVKAARVYSAVSPIMEMLSGFAIAAVIWYGGSQVIEGGTTPGKFTSFITAALLAYKPIKSLSSLNATMQEGLGAAKRLFKLLDTSPQIKDRDGAVTLPLRGGAVAFKNVRFSYSDDKSALKDISFNVPSGKTVALVGPSGGGKSTIMNLILRFYDPDKGSILIDDYDLRDVTIASLRENMAFVGQNIVLFDDTVSANIAYGRPDASEEDIRKAARAAAADSFIQELADGYDTVIGQNGFTLSGGQRQRIAIARAMLRNAPILLLDEATSALDSISEKHIQQALQRLMQGRTTIVIAHRLSTVENADVIHVIKHGNIIESGSHKELIALGGEYSRLYKVGLE